MAAAVHGCWSSEVDMAVNGEKLEGGSGWGLAMRILAVLDS